LVALAAAAADFVDAVASTWTVVACELDKRVTDNMAAGIVVRTPLSLEKAFVDPLIHLLALQTRALTVMVMD